MTVPTRHRDALHSESEGRLTLTRHPDGCLLMYPRTVWEVRRVQIRGWSMAAEAWKRIFLGNANDVEMDNAGRVLISPELREAVALNPDSKVMLLGLGDHFEIWEREAYERHTAATVAAGMPAELANFSL